MKPFFACLAACLLGIAALPTAASALAVQQVFWGFDGQVVPGTFNPFSVLVVNLSSIPFDGQLELRPEVAAGPRSGGVFVVPCYVAPGASRWVQFYPFFHNGYHTNDAGWTLVWGDGPASRFEIDAPTLAAPARVWFAEPGAVAASYDTARLKHFPDDLFPPTVAAADGLNTAVLDHVPRWESARRAAFLDWLRRGGTLHLLPDAAGREPVFTEELALLNTPLDTLRVGNGRVIHHHGAPGDLLHDNALLAADPPAPTLEKGSNQIVYDMDDGFFQSMNRLVRPRVHWKLIYTLTALYLLAVGPGHYFWARRHRDYRLSLVGLAGGVVAFTLVFGLLGQRGFGERSQVMTVATAHALDGNRYDVTQWSNVFVTSGGLYTMTHPAEYSLYTSGTTTEGLAGLAASGRGGGFRVDLPLYSSCALIHRGVMTGDDTAVTPAVWKTSADHEDLTELKFTLPRGFPTAARFRKGWVRFRDKYYAARLANGGLEIAGTGIKADAFFATTETVRPMQSIYYNSRYDKPPPIAEVFASFRGTLMAAELGGNEHFPRYVSRSPQAGDQADLFLFVSDGPETFRLDGANVGSEPSMIMYQRTVFRPQAP